MNSQVVSITISLPTIFLTCVLARVLASHVKTGGAPPSTMQACLGKRLCGLFQTHARQIQEFAGKSADVSWPARVTLYSQETAGQEVRRMQSPCACATLACFRPALPQLGPLSVSCDLRPVSLLCGGPPYLPFCQPTTVIIWGPPLVG